MAVEHSRSTLATPPSRNRVMLRTFTPSLSATREWPSSWSSTETKSSRAVSKLKSQELPRLQDPRACTSGIALQLGWDTTVIKDTIRNQLGCTRKGIPRMLISCQPSPTGVLQRAHAGPRLPILETASWLDTAT